MDGIQYLTVATAASDLGGLDEFQASATSATVTKFAVASTVLGGLVAAAQAKTRKAAVAVASLGGIDASATTKVAKDVIAEASLGGLDATATTKVKKDVVAAACHLMFLKVEHVGTASSTTKMMFKVRATI